MTERGGRTGLVIVIAVVALAGAGVAAWMFWWEPRQARAHDREVVAGWEARWAAARACLLGDTPLAADPGDALALAELQAGSLRSSAAGCTDLVGGITRPEGGAAASAPVEAAFREVEAAVPAVAKAYAFRISAPDDEIDRRVADLGVAIAALDAAQDRLRAVAKLPPLARAGTVSPRHLPAPTPIVAGGAPVAAPDVTAQAGVLAGEKLGTIVERIVVTAPDRGRRIRAAMDGIPSVPDATWMVTTLPGRVFDVAAPESSFAVAVEPTADTIDLGAAKLALPIDSAWVPVAALGDGDARAIVLVPEVPFGQVAPAFAVATSTDAGKTWTLGPPNESSPTVVWAEPDYAAGTVDVAVGTASETEQVAIARFHFDGAAPSTVPPAEPVAGLERSGGCRRGAAVWWLSGTDLGAATPSGAGTVALATSAPLRVADCTASAALVEEGSSPVRYQRCSTSACKPVFQGATYAYGRAAMLDDGTVVYAAGRGAILALWTEGAAAPAYFKLPRAATLDALVVWGNVPYAVLHDPADEHQALSAVPLR